MVLGLTECEWNRRFDYSSILVGVWNVPRCHSKWCVDEGTVGGRVGAGLFEISFVPTYSHARVMTDLFGINNYYNKEEKNFQQWMRLHWICKSDPLDGTTQNSYGRSYVGMYVYQHETRFIVSCMDSYSICFLTFLFYLYRCYQSDSTSPRWSCWPHKRLSIAKIPNGHRSETVLSH